MKLNKIYILGTSGSGKTYLSKKISEKLKIKSYDLDDIYWIRKYAKKLDKKKREYKLKKLLKEKKQWIIEGIYTDWSIYAIKKSDLVIWLDPPFRVRSWRIFKRFLLRKRYSKETWKDCLVLIKFSGKYKLKKNTCTTSFIAHKTILKNHKINFIKLNNNEEINKFLKSLE